MNPNYGNLDVRYNNRFLMFEDHTSYESRNPSMMKLIKDAWELRIKNEEQEEEPVRFFRLYTDDVFNPGCHYSFSSKCVETARRSMPNFVFEAWPECGIFSYEQTFNEMAIEGLKPYKDDRVFWIGNTFMKVKAYDRRHMGAEVSRKHPDMFDFRSINWNFGPDQYKTTPGYISLPDHCRYRVLIDFGGVGFSARIPLLLASGRPVIIVGHPEEAWFYWDATFVPWVHYIPCGSKDGSDISENLIFEAVQWTFENSLECENIGRRGRLYAQKYLSRSAAVKRIGEMLVKHLNV